MPLQRYKIFLNKKAQKTSESVFYLQTNSQILSLFLSRLFVKTKKLIIMAIANYTRTCAKNTPGNAKILITEAANVASVTIDSVNEVTAITMESEKYFEELQVKPNTIRRRQEESGVGGVITVKHIVQMSFIGLSRALNDLRESIHDALACGLVMIILDKSTTPKAWLIGWSESNVDDDALDTIEAEDDSGIRASDEDMGQYNITLSGESGYLDLSFDATTSALIQDEDQSTITFCDFN
ncbi:hypothetical protein ES703_98126 [subsurface metagenome]